MGTHPPGVMTMCTTGTGLAAVEHAVVVHAEQLSRSQQEPWGTLWLTESVLRAVLVLHLAISQAVLIGQPPGIIAIAAGIVFTRLRVPTLRRYLAQHFPGLAEAHGG